MWLENRGYTCGHTFVVGGVYVNVSQKISEGDLDDFEKHFNSRLSLLGASYDNSNQISEFEYYCDHDMLKKFRSHLNRWLKDNGFPVRFSTVSGDIRIICSDKLSDGQISDFESEFESRCRGYEISCNSKEITYEFR